MSCPNCGVLLKPDAKFCGACGSKLSSNTGGNTSYPTVVGSTQSPLGLPPCQFKLIETKGEGPDDEGDIRIELKYSVSNNTKQTWDYLAVTTQLVNFDGQVIEQSTDSFEQTLEPNDDTELDAYFGAVNLKLLGKHPEKSVIISTITACKAEFVSVGTIDIPAEAFQVTSIQPIKLGESAQLLSGSVYKTEPDSDKDCQVQVKALIQNLTNLPLHEVKIIADVTDKSGRELCDAGGYEQLKPGELCLIQGNGYTKEKSLKAAKVEISIRSYSPVAVSTLQTNGLDLSELSKNEIEGQSSSAAWPSPFESTDEANESKVHDNNNESTKRWILSIYIDLEFDEITDVNEWLETQGYDKFFRSLSNIGVFNIVSTDYKKISIPYDASKPISKYKSTDIVFDNYGNCIIRVLLDCELSKHIKIADNKYEAIWNEIAEQVEFTGITLSVIGPMPPHLGNTTLVQQGYQQGEIDTGYFSGVDDAIVEISELPEYLLNAYKKIR
ncbi:Zinc-ribbon domain containing protein [Oxalobacteraceae bacterium]